MKIMVNFLVLDRVKRSARCSLDAYYLKNLRDGHALHVKDSKGQEFEVPSN